MADDNTTDEATLVTGADEAQPVDQELEPAADADTSSEPGESEQGDEAEESAEGEPQVDDKLQKYATSQGLDLDNPNAIKAARLAMENQSKVTKNYQKASELEKAAGAVSDEDAKARAEATGQDPELLSRLQRVEVKESVRDFWNTPNEKGERPDMSFESSMVKLLETKPYLAGDLESLYATAVMKSGGVAAVKSQGKREALESLAHKQQAAVPAGSATTSATPKAKPFAELSIAEMEKKLGVVRQ